MDPILFNKAVQFVNDILELGKLELAQLITEEDKLKLRALFKQSTVGPCTGPRPSFFDTKGKLKYDAWKELGEMNRTLAMQEYVERVVDIAVSIQTSISNQQNINNISSTAKALDLVNRRVNELKSDCSLFWPQRFAHIFSLEDQETAGINYEREEAASYGYPDDVSYGSPIIPTDIRIPLTEKIGNFLTGTSTDSGCVSHSNSNQCLDPGQLLRSPEENFAVDDPLHVKEPPFGLDLSSESINRVSGLAGELYEMITISYRRLDAVEDATRKLQSDLDQLIDRRKRTKRIFELFVILSSATGVIAVLFFILKLRRLYMQSLSRQ